MKKLSFIIALIMAAAMAFSGCGSFGGDPGHTGGGDIGGNTGGNDPGGDNTGNEPGGDKPTEPDDGWDIPPEDLTIAVGNEKSPTYAFTDDGVLDDLKRDKNATINKLAATDDFGRSFGYINGKDGEKYVCLFYFTWLGQHPNEMRGIHDITKLSSTSAGTQNLWNTSGTPDSPLNQYHYWGEPLYGYYNSLDTWVIRKHIELFIAAGIDVLVFDATNGFCYFEVIEQIANILREYKNDGWNVPGFMFYTNTNSGATVRRLYQGTGNPQHSLFERYGFYRDKNFEELWFKPNGKPQIVAVSSDLDSEMKEYFDVWESMWPAETNRSPVAEIYRKNGFPWMDWSSGAAGKADQKLVGADKGGVVNVSVAQHNRAPFSNAVNPVNGVDTVSEARQMWGRGWSKKTGADHSDEAVNSGVNYEEEWDCAIAKDPKYAFVTGWNEWIALKSYGTDKPGEAPTSWGAYFVDTVNREYSRDVEMMKGGYADNFYLQTVRNVRRYKGVEGTQSAAAALTVDVKKGLSQWNSVKSIYDDFTVTATKDYKSSANRNFGNFAGTATYNDDSMRNDIKSVRVTHDEYNVYFLIECVNDIVGKPSPQNNKFMNLLIGVRGRDNSGALGGFDHVVNRLSSYTGECGVEKISKDAGKLAYTQTGKGDFTLKGRYMQVRVSKRSLGIGKNAPFTICFKVADNVADPGDVSSYYASGECAPAGRLGYLYKGN